MRMLHSKQKIHLITGHFGTNVDILALEMDKLAQHGHIKAGKQLWHRNCTYMGETQLRKIRQQRTLRKLR